MALWRVLDYTSAPLRGADCKQYSFTYATTGLKVVFTYSIDKVGGLCMKYAYNVEQGEYSGTFSFEVTEYKTPYTIEIPQVEEPETQYTITFTGENGDKFESTELKDEIFYLPLCPFTKDSCYFSGWRHNGTQTVYKADAPITVTGDMTFTAVFTPLPVASNSVVFDFAFYYELPLCLKTGGVSFDKVTVNGDSIEKSDYELRDGILRIKRSALQSYKIAENTKGVMEVKLSSGGSAVLTENVALINSDPSFAMGLTLNYDKIHITSEDQVFKIQPSFSPSSANVAEFTATMYYGGSFGSYPVSFNAISGEVKADPLKKSVSEGECWIIYSLQSSGAEARVDVTVSIPPSQPAEYDTTVINYFASTNAHKTDIFKESRTINCVVLSDVNPGVVTYAFSSDPTGKTGVSEGQADFATNGTGFSRQFNFAGNLWTINFSYASPVKINKLTSFSFKEQLAPAVIKHYENGEGDAYMQAGGGTVYIEVKLGTDLRSLIASCVCEYDTERNLKEFNGVQRRYTNKSYYVSEGGKDIVIYSEDGYRNIYTLTIKVADKNDLQSALTTALNAKKRYYSFASYSSSGIAAAINAAFTVMDDSTASVSVIAAAANSLTTAMTKLEYAENNQNNLAYLLDELERKDFSIYSDESLSSTNLISLYNNAVQLFEKAAPTETEFGQCYDALSSAYENIVVDINKLQLSFDPEINVISGTFDGLSYFIDVYSEENYGMCYDGQTYIDSYMLENLDKNTTHKLYVYFGDPSTAKEVGTIVNFGTEVLE